MNRRVTSGTIKSKRLLLFVGVHPRVQKCWMTLVSHPWVRWIGHTGALCDLMCPGTHFWKWHQTNHKFLQKNNFIAFDWRPSSAVRRDLKDKPICSFSTKPARIRRIFLQKFVLFTLQYQKIIAHVFTVWKTTEFNRMSSAIF